MAAATHAPTVHVRLSCMTSADIHCLQVLYKPGTWDGISNLLDMSAEVCFARADRLPVLAAKGQVNSSVFKVLAEVCCTSDTHSLLLQQCCC